LYGGANESDSKAAKAAGHELVSSLSSSPSQLPTTNGNEWYSACFFCQHSTHLFFV
jgi:hypothetical protein